MLITTTAMIAIIVTTLIITMITIVKIIMIQNTKTVIPAKKIIIKVLVMLTEIKVVIEVMFYAVFYLFNRLPHK